jgi:hypothetical protein
MWTVDLPRLPPQQDVDVPKQKPHPPRPQPAPATRAGRPLVAGALVGSLALFAVGALSALLWGANARDSIELAKAAPLPTVFVVGPPEPALPQRSRLSAKPQRPPAAPPPAASEKAAIDPRNPWVGVACRDPDFFRCTPLPPLD